MKKLGIVFSLFLLLLGALPASASPVKEGVFLSGFYVGGAFGLENSGMEFDGNNFAWGHAGLELGLSGQYFLNDYLALGGDLHYAGFDGSDKSYWDRSTVPYKQHEMSLNLETWNFFATGRAYFNPARATRFYVPFGLGMVVGHGKFRYKESSTNTSLRASSTSLGAGGFAGIGLENDIYEGNLTIGLEMRYNMYRYNIGQLADRVEADNSPGKRTYSYLSLLMVVTFQ